MANLHCAQETGGNFTLKEKELKKRGQSPNRPYTIFYPQIFLKKQKVLGDGKEVNRLTFFLFDVIFLF